MSFTIDYSTLSPAEKHHKALTDAVNWLGTSATSIARNLREAAGEGTTPRQLINMMEFAGVRGLPARKFVFHALGKFNN